MNRYLKIAALALLGTSAFAASKESSDLLKVPSGSTSDVIVQFASKPTTTMLNQVTAQGATLKQQLPLIKSAVYSIPQRAFLNVANLSTIKYMSPNRKVKKKLDFAEPAVNAMIAFQSGWDGSGIGVAVIDSGIDSRPDLTNSTGKTSRVVYSQSFWPAFCSSS